MSATSPARIRALFAYALAFRRALDNPAVLGASRPDEIIDEYMMGPGWTPQLEETSEAIEIHNPAMHRAWLNVVGVHMDSQEEMEDGQNPNDAVWKASVLSREKIALDSFLLLNPDQPAAAPAAGGKRRKTRKGKSKRSRRTRYSRRR